MMIHTKSVKLKTAEEKRNKLREYINRFFFFVVSAIIMTYRANLTFPIIYNNMINSNYKDKIMSSDTMYNNDDIYSLLNEETH